jgi:serine/threonine protein kinase
MGEVYKARDPRLNRLVALKLLPVAAASDAERRERFEREAQALAALNHPNIVTIHSVEEADGRFFLTMELVDGRSLADAIPPAGLPLDRLMKIAIPVADAAAAAHQKGITHPTGRARRSAGAQPRAGHRRGDPDRVACRWPRLPVGDAAFPAR